tara:strand:+ start:214 stop:534 length:321 start_codon:yes stop_codon:yes gene_type:complete
MPLPIVKEETIIAVASKAMTQDPQQYSLSRLRDLSENGQSYLADALATTAECLGEMLAAKFPIDESMREDVAGIMTLALAAASCMAFDMVNAQIEADDLTEMFSDE